MVNNYHELDELFSSSNQEGQNKETTPSSIINSPTSFELETIQDELFEQMILEKEAEQEESISLKERQIECLDHELRSKQNQDLETNVQLLGCDSTKNCKEVEIEVDKSEEDICLSSENESAMIKIVPKRAESGEGFDFFMDGHEFKSDYFKRFDKEKRKSLRVKEEKERRYHVEKVEPRTDFSEYGELADIFEEQHKQKMIEYKQNLERVKKLKAEDKERENLQKQLKREKLAKERSDRKVERIFKKLQSKIYLLGHYSKVVGFNESQTLLKLSIPRTYHRIVDKLGYIIKTAPFIELSQTNNSFYSYNPRTDKFELYANLGEVTKGKYALINVTDTQQQMWDYFKEGDKEKRFGFALQKFDKIESGRYY